MKYSYLLTAFFAIFLSFASAEAQLERAFVSTGGTDSGTCGTLAAPCRDFPAALSRTTSGGVILALDSGVYALSNITITKSVTLAAAPGVHADLYNAVIDNRITVNASTSDIVILRNLTLTGKPGGTNAYGIGVYTVGTLEVENCVIDRFSEGLGTSMGNAAQFFIKDTIVKNSLSNGITFYTSTGLIKASIEDSQFINNGNGGTFHGVNVQQNARVTIRNSVASGNSGAGFYALRGDLNLENCEASNNQDGVVSTGNTQGYATVTVSNSTVTNNTRNGFYELGGVFNSFGNNFVRRNNTNVSGTVTVLSGN